MPTDTPGTDDLSARLVNTARKRAWFSETTDAAAFTAAVPLADALGEIAALHRVTDHLRRKCLDCDMLWPCPTVAIINALEQPLPVDRLGNG